MWSFLSIRLTRPVQHDGHILSHFLSQIPTLLDCEPWLQVWNSDNGRHMTFEIGVMVTRCCGDAWVMVAGADKGTHELFWGWFWLGNNEGWNWQEENQLQKLERYLRFTESTPNLLKQSFYLQEPPLYPIFSSPSWVQNFAFTAKSAGLRLEWNGSKVSSLVVTMSGKSSS